MAKRTSTTEDVMKESNLAIAKAEGMRKENYRKLSNEPRVDVFMPPSYQPYFGKVMTVSISGIPIYLPVDGKRYKVPKTYADEVESRRRGVDRMLNRQGRMSNIRGNFERSAGAIRIF